MQRIGALAPGRLPPLPRGRSARRRSAGPVPRAADWAEAEEAECGPAPPTADNSLSDRRRTGPRLPGETEPCPTSADRSRARLPKRAPPGQGGQAAGSVGADVVVRSHKKGRLMPPRLL